MWEKVKHVVVAILVVLVVLFGVLMFWPEDEKEVKEANKKEEVTENQEEEQEEEETKEQEKESATVDISGMALSENTLKFSATSLEGEKVEQSIFADYDLTIVHVWGTFCSPCIAEMGEYAKLYEELPANVNLIGLVCDVEEGSDSNVSSAQNILKNAGANFVNLKTGEGWEEVLDKLQYVPSSFFVDKEGHVVGKVLDGAGIEDTKKRLDKYIKE